MKNDGRGAYADAALLRAEHARALKKHVAALNRLIAEVREYVPGANYYLAMENLNILSGDSHEGYRESARQDRIMASEILHYAAGGDW